MRDIVHVPKNVGNATSDGNNSWAKLGVNLEMFGLNQSGTLHANISKW